MRFSVEPSPAGGYFVRLQGADAPVSRHDTEDEAESAAASYRRGAEASPPPRATPTAPTPPRRT
jgi:Uncharacterized protein conserved in bacteria (DUF2188)